MCGPSTRTDASIAYSHEPVSSQRPLAAAAMTPLIQPCGDVNSGCRAAVSPWSSGGDDCSCSRLTVDLRSWPMRCRHRGFYTCENLPAVSSVGDRPINHSVGGPAELQRGQAQGCGAFQACPFTLRDQPWNAPAQPIHNNALHLDARAITTALKTRED